MTYLGWQITNMKDPLPENIRKALEFHEKKYGRVPNVVEYSIDITRQGQEVPVFDGVMFRAIHIPKNILLVGVE